MSDIQTQVKINKVNNGRYNVSLDCDIPALGKKEFKFIENKAELYKQVGNSVSIPMVREIGKQIIEQLLINENNK